MRVRYSVSRRLRGWRNFESLTAHPSHVAFRWQSADKTVRGVNVHSPFIFIRIGARTHRTAIKWEESCLRVSVSYVGEIAIKNSEESSTLEITATSSK
ncbi:hypothetical protein WN51_08286 [Melipona quadrifasciata]|uniref:Uncharacterized protein n=1 Tax=Melipona quadrifasciata TaxID=166423 RepID=A0A0M8ZQA1_9HYME|nr:hypothetical protein WN51_08286 [Melipona quadrifasciata]